MPFTRRTPRARRILGLAAALAVALVAHPSSFTSPAQAASAPTSPTLASAEVAANGKSVTMSWRHNGGSTSATKVSHYEMVYRKTGTTKWRTSSVAAVGQTYRSRVTQVRGQTSYTRAFRGKGMAPGTRYDVGVRAVNAKGQRGKIGLAWARVRLLKNTATARATGDATGAIRVEWSKHTSSPFRAYDIHVVPESTSGAGARIATIGSAGTTSRKLSGYAPGRYKVAVRANQSYSQKGDTRTRWVRMPYAITYVTVPPAADANHPGTVNGEKLAIAGSRGFVSRATGEPYIVNGSNIKRATHKVKGVWQTPYVIQEIEAMTDPGAPHFNTIRLALDWPYFQRKIDGKVQPDLAAFAELDKVIARASELGFDLILDPIHLANINGYCTEDPVMAGAHRDVPAWAWEKVGAKPGKTCETTNAYNELTDDVLALPETADYLKYFLKRYGSGTKLGQSVIALDVVNEPHADGATAPARMQKLVDTVYKPWLATSGTKSLRAVDPDKPIIITPPGGSGSLKGVNFSNLNTNNVMITLHDYFGQGLKTDAKYGLGYDISGWSTAMESTDQTSSTAMGGKYVPYDPARKSYAKRYEEHLTYVKNFVADAKKVGMGVYIGEYGIMNPCNGGREESSARYFTDTSDIYDRLGLSRTVWANGYWDDMAVMWRDAGTCAGTDKWDYFDYATVITDGAVR
jgi:hypothetical protein